MCNVHGPNYKITCAFKHIFCFAIVKHCYCFTLKYRGFRDALAERRSDLCNVGEISHQVKYTKLLQVVLHIWLLELKST